MTYDTAKGARADRHIEAAIRCFATGNKLWKVPAEDGGREAMRQQLRGARILLGVLFEQLDSPPSLEPLHMLERALDATSRGDHDPAVLPAKRQAGRRLTRDQNEFTERCLDAADIQWALLRRDEPASTRNAADLAILAFSRPTGERLGVRMTSDDYLKHERKRRKHLGREPFVVPEGQNAEAILEYLRGVLSPQQNARHFDQTSLNRAASEARKARRRVARKRPI